MKRLLFLVIASTLCTTAFAQNYVDYYREGVKAYEQDDFESFLENFRKADSLRPNHRVLLYNLAAGSALTNQPDKAIEALNYRSGFYAVNDFESDKDFNSILNTEGLNTLKLRLEELNSLRRSSTPAFEVSIDGFHAEGIAFNKENNRFYITDIRNGWVYSVGMNGNDLKKEIDLRDLGYWSAMGIKFDPNNSHLLWITSAAVPNFIGYSDSLRGRSAVLNIDLRSASLIKSYEIEGTHVFGDLIFAKDGTMLVSDSGEPKIYRLDPEEGKLEEFLSSPNWWNLQGIALSGTKNVLYVSDYITGIYKVNLETKSISSASEKNELLRGSDGIYVLGNYLIALQNGAEPKRIATITLDENGNGIPSSTMYPDNALPELDEPTLGVVVGDYLYYIANSPWAYYDDDLNPIQENWMPLKVNRLSLE